MDPVDSAGVRRSDCELEFRAIRGADREAFSNETMFPDSLRRKLQDSLDRASGLRNTGESVRWWVSTRSRGLRPNDSLDAHLFDR